MEFVEEEGGETAEDFIDELEVKKENKIYKIQFGTNENDLIIKITSDISKNLFYYQKSFTKNELNNLSKTFKSYAPKEIIEALKKSKFDIEEKYEELSLKFNIFSMENPNELIKFKLKKCLLDKNDIINNLVDEIISIKNNTL